jgi:hypothetical protein
VTPLRVGAVAWNNGPYNLVHFSSFRLKENLFKIMAVWNIHEPFRGAIEKFSSRESRGDSWYCLEALIDGGSEV